ncbi:MAG: DUF2141 domain-containing protein [Acidobacteria bacterium]|nr:DUF2141 domain-containing protein [Acidobacteriota bacterium]
MHLLVCLLLAGLGLFGQSATLTVNVKGFGSDKGSAMAALYDDAGAYPTKEAKSKDKQMVKIVQGVAVFTFKGVAPGTYAVAVYHDENGNGKMDTNFIGIPKEKTGASNDAKGKMGPPKFQDAKFVVSGDLAISITMQ